nr:MAG TPA: tail-collar fiber protein [Caudoviricetes sp.]
MKFNGITKKGREYLAKVQAENLPIQFSKIKIGDGRLDDYDDPTELTALRNLKVELGILSKTQEAETVTLITNIDNVSLAQGYYPREIGVFVRDGDREILYYYMNDGDETSWVPPESDGPFKIGLKINLIVSNAQSIVVQNSGKDLYITKEYLEENYTKNGGSNNNALQIEDRVTAAVGGLAGMFPLSQATANNIYYCEGNKKFYVCKSNYDGTRISVPNMNFEELSIFENRKRLENLLKIKEYTVRNFLLSDKGNLKNYYYGSLPLDIPYSKVLFLQVIDHGESVLETARISESNNLFVEAVSWIDNPKNLAIKVKVIYTE